MAVYHNYVLVVGHSTRGAMARLSYEQMTASQAREQFEEDIRRIAGDSDSQPCTGWRIDLVMVSESPIEIVED